jgi:hypothetical protein
MSELGISKDNRGLPLLSIRSTALKASTSDTSATFKTTSIVQTPNARRHMPLGYSSHAYPQNYMHFTPCSAVQTNLPASTPQPAAQSQSRWAH